MTTKRFRRVLLAGVLAAGVLSLPATPASAGGATQVSGVAEADGGDACDPVGFEADYSLNLAGADGLGDLQGCLYGFVETYVCHPSGTYQETGTELYVDDVGTFETEYRFTAKFADCPTLGGEIHGRCQHPIVDGSGTDGYEGVRGRLDFKDDIGAGNFPYRGHLK